VIGYGISVVVNLQDNERDIIAWFVTHYPRLRPIAYIMPTLIVSLFNSALPMFTKIMVAFEQHDYPETRTRHEVFRNFFITMVNLGIFTLINYKGIFDTTFVDNLFGTNFKRQFTETS